MQPEEYRRMADLEERHWWFVARRRIISELLSTLALPQNARLLEAGCGTGGNLRMLSRFGEVWAMEMDAFAREKARERGIARSIEEAVLPERPAFKGESFDAIVLFDVLEHLKEDVKSLAVLREQLAENGKLVITVPAFPFLWSDHDVACHHQRRYTKAVLCQAVREAGYRVTYVSYFNCWLFPLIAFVRFFQRAMGKSGSDLQMPSETVNRVLTKLFASERHFIGRGSFPVGVSLALTAEKA